MSDPIHPEFASAAEERVHAELEVVRMPAAEADSVVAQRVARTLRWQALVLVPMTVAVSVFAGVAEAAKTVLDAGAGP